MSFFFKACHQTHSSQQIGASLPRYITCPNKHTAIDVRLTDLNRSISTGNYQQIVV